MKASYDVTFVPMTNVAIETSDPRKLSDEEREAVIRLAAEKIREDFQEKLSGENVAEIRIYDIDGVAVEPKTVFDSGLLRLSANPVDEALRFLTELAQSGYIPFSSPAPSSTEVKLRNCITLAISLLEVARGLERDLHYR